MQNKWRQGAILCSIQGIRPIRLMHNIGSVACILVIYSGLLLPVNEIRLSTVGTHIYTSLVSQSAVCNRFPKGLPGGTVLTRGAHRVAFYDFIVHVAP